MLNYARKHYFERYLPQSKDVCTMKNFYKKALRGGLIGSREFNKDFC